MKKEIEAIIKENISDAEKSNKLEQLFKDHDAKTNFDTIPIYNISIRGFVYLKQCTLKIKGDL